MNMATPTRMLVSMMLVFARAAFAQDAPAQTLFAKCDAALQTPEYAPLRRELPGLPIEELSRCQRLSNREFLVTANPPGPYNGPASNFFYCDLRAAAPACSQDQMGNFYPDLEFLKEFTGASGKRFALWRVSSLHRGLFLSGFHMFQLVPKSQSPRGYAIYPLPAVGDLFSYVDGGDAARPCNGLDVREARKLQAFEVADQATAKVRLRFTFAVTRCDNGEVSERVSEFRLVNGRFAAFTPPAPR